MNSFAYFSYLQEFPFANEIVYFGGWVRCILFRNMDERGLLRGLNLKVLYVGFSLKLLKYLL